MGLILAIIIGISVGLSYLITDYFFRTKELELNDKGGQVAMMVRYFNALNMDPTILRDYLTSMDQLVGARIWLFNTRYELIGAWRPLTSRSARKGPKPTGSTPS